MKMNLKSQMKNNLKRMSKLDHYLIILVTYVVTQSSLQEQSHYLASISQEKFGINLRMLKTVMNLRLNKQYSQDAKILTLELEFMLEVIIHILHLEIYLIQSLRTIMGIRKMQNIIVIWITPNCNALHLIPKRPS